MPPVSLDDVKITSNGNSVTIGDSVKIVVSGTGQSPTKVKITRSPTPTNMTADTKTVDLSDHRERSKSPAPKKTDGIYNTDTEFRNLQIFLPSCYFWQEEDKGGGPGGEQAQCGEDGNGQIQIKIKSGWIKTRSQTRGDQKFVTSVYILRISSFIQHSTSHVEYTISQFPSVLLHSTVCLRL